MKELVRERNRLEQEIAVLEQQLENVNVDIKDMLAMQLQTVRAAQAKEFGAVGIVAEGYKVTETIPKRVKWDQNKMAEIFQTIKNHGDDPFQYMKVELGCNEKAYEKFDDGIKAVFDEARIVEKGKPSLKIEEVHQEYPTCKGAENA